MLETENRRDSEAQKSATSEHANPRSEVLKKLTLLSGDFIAAVAERNGKSVEDYNHDFESAVFTDKTEEEPDHEAYAKLNALSHRLDDGEEVDLHEYGAEDFLAAVEAHTQAIQAANNFSEQENTAINHLNRDGLEDVLVEIVGDIADQMRQASSGQERWEIRQEKIKVEDFLNDFHEYENGVFPTDDDLTSANQYLNIRYSNRDLEADAFQGYKDNVSAQINRNIVFAKYAPLIAQKAVKRMPEEAS